MGRRNQVDELSSSAAGRTSSTESRPIPQQRTRYFINRSPSASSLNVSSSSTSSKKSRTTSGSNNRINRTANDFESVMIVSSSPCETPPRKRWEGNWNKILRSKNQHHSLSSSPSSSITSAPITEDMSTGTIGSAASISTAGGGAKGTKKKGSFSLIPGSKRLVSRNSARNTGSKSSVLSSIFSKSSGRINRGHKSMDALDVPMRNGLDRSKSSSVAAKSQPNGVVRRRNQSLPIESSETLALAKEAIAAVSQYSMRREVSEESVTPVSTNPQTFTGALKEQLTGSSSYHSMNKAPTSGHPQNSYIEPITSADWQVNLNGNEGVEEPKIASSVPSYGSLTQLHRARSGSRTHIYSSNSNSRTNTPVTQYSYPQHNELDLRNMPEIPSMKGFNIHTRVPSPIGYHDVGLNLDDDMDNIHIDDAYQHKHDNLQSNMVPSGYRNMPNLYSCSNTTSTINTGGGIPEPPENLSEIFGGLGGIVTMHTSSSSYLLGKMDQQNIISASPETKKAFTKIHNSSEYGNDSNSPFLGGHKASNLDLAGTYKSYSTINHNIIEGGHGRTQYGSIPHKRFLSGQQNRITEESRNSSSNLLSKSLPQNAFIEENSVHKSSRLLKPVQSAESWVEGRRYLIAPAALAACPLSTIQSLTGLPTQSVTEAATSMDPSKASGAIELGDAFMTYVGDKYHLTFGKWSSCRLVLRQNYLFEYDLSAPLTSPPRGIAHLAYATAHAQQDFQDALELHFYASPCAKVDHRILLIRVKNVEERDHWITCLNRAARLRVEDLWEFHEDLPLGSGRYASIFPARRKEADVGKSNCALKVIDKNEFWRLVIKGRERPDTIVRELVVQSTLTATFGTKPTLLQIRGFFETSDKVVIELELLDGKDLFDYISSKGVLEEEETAFIGRDILIALDNMNQAGIAHRDIKPANILMATCDESKYGISVKIGDFGMSTLIGVDGLVRGRCGSPGYVAPEIFKAGPGEGYGNQVDIFSAGVTLYLMLCGYEPFYGETEKELIKANKNAELEFPESEWGKISSEARDLVYRMLETDPEERITAKDALEHPWIVQLEQDQKYNTKNNEQLVIAAVTHPQEGICAIM